MVLLSLAGKDIAIYLKTRLEKEEVKDFSVAGNTISWTFYSYWSSSEFSAYLAYRVAAFNGGVQDGIQGGSLYVRPWAVVA